MLRLPNSRATGARSRQIAEVGRGNVATTQVFEPSLSDSSHASASAVMALHSDLMLCTRPFVSCVSARHSAAQKRCRHVHIAHRAARTWFAAIASAAQLTTYVSGLRPSSTVLRSAQSARYSYVGGTSLQQGHQPALSQLSCAAARALAHVTAAAGTRTAHCPATMRSSVRRSATRFLRVGRRRQRAPDCAAAGAPGQTHMRCDKSGAETSVTF
jgi:hypothetical protein